MAVFPACEIVLLGLLSTIGIAKGEFKFVEPYPSPIYPIEYSAAKVTCVAYDDTGDKIPEKIMFKRVDDFDNHINLTEGGNLYFTGRTEENGRKLFVTMHIINVTMEDDSSSDKGSYECHAYAVNHNIVKKYGFSVNVVEESEIPKVAISQVGVLERGSNVPIFCNLTERGSQKTNLLDISLTKNGVLKHKVNVSDDPLNSTILLGPVVLENVGVDDGGAYACLLNMKLKNKRPYRVTDSTLVRIAPWFEHGGEKKVTKKKGQDATLDCSARGFPLNVEWKYKKDDNDEIVTCIDFSKEKPYNIERNGLYDPYNLTVADLETTHSGTYYCCLPSNCSEQIEEDRCQKFVLTVEEYEDKISGSMSLKSHGLFVVVALSVVSFLFL